MTPRSAHGPKTNEVPLTLSLRRWHFPSSGYTHQRAPDLFSLWPRLPHLDNEGLIPEVPSSSDIHVVWLCASAGCSGPPLQMEGAERHPGRGPEK